MKIWNLIFNFACVLLLVTVGCDNGSIVPRPVKPTEEGFPEVMVGVWEQKNEEFHKWGIKFESDGSISKIIHPMAGPVNIAEGGSHAEAPDGSYYTFVMGPCDANYIPSTNMLKVKILIDYFAIKIPVGILEGRSEDYFEGPVSQDGKTWKANWLGYGWVEGGNPPPIEKLKERLMPMVFTKTDLTQIPEKN